MGSHQFLVVPVPCIIDGLGTVMNKKIVVCCMIAAALVALGLFSFWPQLDPPVRAAVISGVFTAATALLGAALLVWQIGRQAMNAIAANRTTEALKLKKDVYVEITTACSAVSKAQSELLTYVQRFESGLDFAETVSQFGAPAAPSQRAIQLSTLYFAASSAMISLIGVQERWEIIDPRTAIFRKAFAHAAHELRKAWKEYSGVAAHDMPYDRPDTGAVSWVRPTRARIAELKAIGDKLREGVALHTIYLVDLQVEMQNLLLGELFAGNKVTGRTPRLEHYRTVRLDDVAALETYFASTDAFREAAEGQSQATAS